MHVGHNMPTSYYLRDGHQDNVLQIFGEEHDLGVYASANFKSSLKCRKVAAKATSILGMIRRNFKKISRQCFITLYKTYVRPHTEYCVQTWSPSLISDIECLEKV